MSHRIIRNGVLAALAAGSLLVPMPGAANAAVPVAGYYSGATIQPKLNAADPAEQPYAGSVDFKVLKYSSSNRTARKLLRVGATTQLRCASGEVKEDTFLVYIIAGGKIDRLGRFNYAYKGLTIRGRFTSRTSAKGTLSRTVGDCKVEHVSWTAKRSAGGLPIPQAPPSA